MADFVANIMAKLDTSQIAGQIKQIESQHKLKIQVDTSTIVSQIQSALNGANIRLNFGNTQNLLPNLQHQFQQQGQAASKGFVQSFQSGLGQIQTYTNNAANTISDMQRTLASMKFDRSSIDLVTKDLNSMNLEISNIQTKIGQKGLNLQIRGIDELGRSVSIIKQFDYESGKITSLGKTINQTFSTSADSIRQFSSLQFKLDTGQFEHSIANIRQRFEELRNAPSYVVNNMNALNAAFATLNNSGASMSDKVQAMQLYSQLMPVLASQIRDVEKAENDFTQANARILSNDMTTWLNNNGKAAQQFSAEISNLQQRLQNVKSPKDLREISTRFREIKSEAKAFGGVMSDVGKRITTTVRQLLGIGTTVMLIRQVIRVARKMYEEVKAVDTAMVELRKVTDETSEAYNKFLSGVGKNAQKIGTSMSDLINATADFGRLGYSLTDAEGLAKVASIYNVVGDEIGGIDNATQSLISTMAAFKAEMSDMQTQESFALSIIDKFNEVGKTRCPAA